MTALTEAVVIEHEDNQEAAYSPILYKFTNQEQSDHLDNLLAMFYDGVYKNEIGIAGLWNLETEQEELALVAVIPTPDGKAQFFPIAKVLSAEEVRNYLSPNGKGGWFDPQNPTEAAEALEGMKTIEEATEVLN